MTARPSAADRKLIADYLSMVLREYGAGDIGRSLAQAMLSEVIVAAAGANDYKAAMRQFLRGNH